MGVIFITHDLGVVRPIYPLDDIDLVPGKVKSHMVSVMFHTMVMKAKDELFEQ